MDQKHVQEVNALHDDSLRTSYSPPHLPDNETSMLPSFLTIIYIWMSFPQVEGRNGIVNKAPGFIISLSLFPGLLDRR